MQTYLLDGLRILFKVLSINLSQSVGHVRAGSGAYYTNGHGYLTPPFFGLDNVDTSC